MTKQEPGSKGTGTRKTARGHGRIRVLRWPEDETEPDANGAVYEVEEWDGIGIRAVVRCDGDAEPIATICDQGRHGWNGFEIHGLEEQRYRGEGIRNPLREPAEFGEAVRAVLQAWYASGNVRRRRERIDRKVRRERQLEAYFGNGGTKEGPGTGGTKQDGPGGGTKRTGNQGRGRRLTTAGRPK